MSSEENKSSGTQSASQAAEDAVLGAELNDGEEGPPKTPVSSRFSRFVASLHMACLYHLGLVPGPGGENPKPNLELSRENIDILEMLEVKTKGNLDEYEEGILRGVLSEVRMAYIQTANKGVDAG